jgi:predicted deacylase
MDRHRFLDTDVAPGSRSIARLPITTRLDGSMLTVPIHVVRGATDGPTLLVVSALHGSEWFSVEVVHRVVTTVDPAGLRGTLIAIPVANPMAFERFTRMTPDESDEPDLNRVWPGGTTWITEQIAAVLDREILARTDYLIDLHTGPWGTSLAGISYSRDLPDRSVNQRSLEMAVAFGYPVIRALDAMSVFPGPRSITAYAGSARGIPSIGPNLGGAGFAPEAEAEWRDGNVAGTLGVMRHLGMLPGDPDLAPRYFHFATRGIRVVPRHGGMLRPLAGPEELGGPVAKGQPLGTIISPYTFDVLEELVAPADGILFGIGRDYPVRPGDWCYFVADASEPTSRWVDSGPDVAGTARLIAGDGP